LANGRANGTPYTAISGAPGPPVRFDGLTALSLPKGRCLDPGWAPWRLLRPGAD